MLNNNLITIKEPKSPISEAYRTLRTNIKFSSFDDVIKTIFVTSSMPGEGKSTTSVNFAVTLAQGGDKVILIDCDLRKPNIHKLFNISNEKGLSNAISNLEDKDELIHKNLLPNLDVLTSGVKVPNPSELLSSKSMRDFIKMLGSFYDYIILDTPPVAVITDAQIISQYADGGIFVVASGEVDRDVVIKAKNMLKQVNSRILGVILNKVGGSGKGYYNYNYYYYSNDETKEKRRKKIGFFRKISFIRR